MIPRVSTRPRYPYPLHLVVFPALRVLLGMPSSPCRDAAPLLAHVRPQPRVLNAHNIPPEAPFVLVVNHYDRPGLGAWWGIMTMFCAISERRTREPRAIRFCMAREWWYPGGLGRLVKQPFTRWFFGQIAKTYGVIRLPPVLDSGLYRGEAVAPIRHAIALTRGSNPQLVGLAIEGHTGPGLALCRPPRGAGLFLLLLTHERLPCLPVGLFEDEQHALTVNFGEPVSLSVPRNLAREERDQAAIRRIMVEIGKLLPQRMWGVYREEITAAKVAAPALQNDTRV